MLTRGAHSAALRARYAGGRMRTAVYGAFSKGIYLQTPEGRLILLHDREIGLIPFGIAVSGFVRGVIAEMALRPGMEGAFDNGRLTFLQCPVVIALREEPVPGVSPLIPAAQERKQRMALWESRLIEQGNSAVLPLLNDALEDNPFTSIARGPLDALCHALCAGQQAQIHAALLELIGLGIGLTPSLDDFLDGLMYTLCFSQRNWGQTLPGTGYLAGAVQSLAGSRTNPYSAAYLVSAAAGERFSVLEDFLDGQDFLSDAAGENLLKIGSSSGADMMCGMILALRLLELPKGRPNG